MSGEMALNNTRVTVSSGTLVLPCSFCPGLHGCVTGCKSCTLVLLQVTFQDKVGEDQLQQLKGAVVKLMYAS